MTGTITVDDLAQELAEGLPLPQDRTIVNLTLSVILELQDDTELPPYARNYELQQLRSFARNQLVRPRYRARTPRHLLRWYPGGESEDGFLGWGEHLEEVIAADSATLAAHNVTAQVLGQQLRAALERPAKSRQGGNLMVEKNITRGYQYCPFDDCAYRTVPCPYSDSGFTIVNQTNGKGIVGPGLAWHLIEMHCFFQGRHSPYRSDPLQLMTVISP